MQPVSIFDMDKTITRAATFGPFLAYAVPRFAPWRIVLLPLVLLTSLGFALGLVRRGRLFLKTVEGLEPVHGVRRRPAPRDRRRELLWSGQIAHGRSVVRCTGH